MNEIIEAPRPGIVAATSRMSVAEVVQHAKAVLEVMQAVMREGEHYGKIPGTDKPTLLKAGAEKLCMAFRIADEYRVEDLSTADAVRYRVTCVGIHQTSGVTLGSGMGECSTSEEKFRWRKAICKEEFEATPSNMRRIKYARGKGGGHYTQEQVRMEPADLANTVLKMACKRAKMAMVLNATAASDCFTQDWEELDATLREHLSDEHGAPPPPPPPAGPATWPADAFAQQFPRWEKAIKSGLKTVAEIFVLARSKGALTQEQEAALLAIKVEMPAATPAPAPAGPPLDAEAAAWVAGMDAAAGNSSEPSA